MGAKKKYITMKDLAKRIEKLVEQGKYDKSALLFLKETGLKIEKKHIGYKKHFIDDDRERHVFKITFKCKGKQYTFDFGNSIVNGGKTPTDYDILACLTKSDPYYFEDFCDNFGLDKDKKESKKIYLKVCREWEALNRLFNEKELEALTYIN